MGNGKGGRGLYSISKGHLVIAVFAASHRLIIPPYSVLNVVFRKSKIPTEGD